MFNNDPRWEYLWTSRHQFFYELLRATKDEEVEWFSNQAGLIMPGLCGLNLKYLAMFRGKMVEIDCTVTSFGDAVLGRIMSDLQRELTMSLSITKLFHTDYDQKWKEFNASQSGILFDKGPVEVADV